MAAVFLLPLFYLVPIVAITYAHARWRGVRVELWKWVASASFLMAAGAVAGVVALAGGTAPAHPDRRPAGRRCARWPRSPRSWWSKPACWR